jgi:hypothetical protein
LKTALTCFKRFPATERNGQGEAVSGGYAEVTINYPYLSLGRLYLLGYDNLRRAAKQAAHVGGAL